MTTAAQVNMNDGKFAEESIGCFDIDVDINSAGEWVVSIYQWIDGVDITNPLRVVKLLVKAEAFVDCEESKDYFDQLVKDYTSNPGCYISI